MHARRAVQIDLGLVRTRDLGARGIRCSNSAARTRSSSRARPTPDRRPRETIGSSSRVIQSSPFESYRRSNQRSSDPPFKTARRATEYGSPVAAMRARMAAFCLSCGIVILLQWRGPGVGPPRCSRWMGPSNTRGLSRSCPLRPHQRRADLGSDQAGVAAVGKSSPSCNQRTFTLSVRTGEPTRNNIQGGIARPVRSAMTFACRACCIHELRGLSAKCCSRRRLLNMLAG